jgi:hypothetical protein
LSSLGLDHLFTFVYLGECVLRVLAMGRATYLMSRWNRYDLFVTIYGFVMLCLGSLTYRLFFLTLLLHLSRALRIFRVRTTLRDDPSTEGLSPSRR